MSLWLTKVLTAWCRQRGKLKWCSVGWCVHSVGCGVGVSTCGGARVLLLVVVAEPGAGKEALWINRLTEQLTLTTMVVGSRCRDHIVARFDILELEMLQCCPYSVGLYMPIA